MSDLPPPNVHRKLLWLVGFVAIGMFSFAFALVPIYNVMCKQLGINGKTGGATTYEHVTVDNDRTVEVQFIVTKNEQIPWHFKPNTHHVTLHPGQLKKVTYFASNDTAGPMTVQAIPSVTPAIAAKYLKKIECFCFQKQTLAGGKSANMPLIFHLDPHLPKSIKTVTLSYTLFDVTPKKESRES